MNGYVVITPARDEEKLLPGLIASMAAQSRLPDCWIVIDDGSTDRTPALIDEAARKYRWIESHHLPRWRARAPGGESVVMRFLPRARWEEYQYILRLDADLTFGADLADLLLAEFEHRQRLGLAGATLYEPSPSGRGWHEIRSPGFHTRGAVKMYSRACFSAIGGLEPGLGWDTVDEVRAMMAGFVTRSFTHIRAFHHRPQGGAGGHLKSRWSAGCAAYQTGYSPLFMLGRAVRQTLRLRPLSGVALLLGYFSSQVRGYPRVASPEMIRFVRQQQLRRLLLMGSVWR